jgi:hypothetical protein
LSYHYDYIHLDITQLDEWKTVSVATVKQNGGSGLLNHYKSSLIKALRTVYPNHPWNTVHKVSMPRDHWKDPTNRKKFLDKMAAQLSVL